MFLKKKLKNEGVTVKRLYTINQIAINHLMNKIKQLPDDYKEPLFWDKKKGITRRTLRTKEIHSAYRGGRVEAFSTGELKKVIIVDANSLYGFSASKIKGINLKSERFFYNPLECGILLKDILNKIGLSRVLLYNESDEWGFIPIRTNTSSFYPKTNKYIIGTYTHIEINHALNNGYKPY